MIVGFNLLHIKFIFTETGFPNGNTLQHHSINYCSNSQTVYPIPTVSLMCRLLSYTISSLLFSIDNRLCVLITNN